MNKTLLRILIRNNEVNKWVPTKHLVEIPFSRSPIVGCMCDVIG